MAASPIPETAQRADWPRLVARRANDLEKRLSAAERVAVRSVTASGAIVSSDVIVVVDATAGAVSIALPAAAISRGRVLYIKKIDATANTVTLDPIGAETIDGAATKATAVQYYSFTIVCDGSGWWIV